MDNNISNRGKLAERTVQDFEREMQIVDFPFKEIILNADSFKQELYKEFKNSESIPKLSLYIQEFISEKEWSEGLHSNTPILHSSNKYEIIAASFVPFTEVEKKFFVLQDQFNDLVRKKNLDGKYYGRYLVNTPTIKILQQLNQKVEALKKYVLSDINILSYQSYAVAAADAIIELLNKVKIDNLKPLLLRGIKDDDSNFLITIKFLYEFNGDIKSKEARDRYDILKTYFNSRIIVLTHDSIYNKKLNFISDLLDSIKILQKNDTNATCILNIRNSKPDKETSFRYWFKDFFSIRYPDAVVTAEEEKGNGRIDLKVSHKAFGDKIIEFKGWWNQDKKQSAEQLCSYLTDFEKEGYIFMINHLKKKDITEDYKFLIQKPSMNYMKDSWKEHKFENTDMVYYESKHRFAVKEKTVYHFIFNVYF